MYFMLRHYCKLASKDSFASPVPSNLQRESISRWKDTDHELSTFFFVILQIAVGATSLFVVLF